MAKSWLHRAHCYKNYIIVSTWCWLKRCRHWRHCSCTCDWNHTSTFDKAVIRTNMLDIAEKPWDYGDIAKRFASSKSTCILVSHTHLVCRSGHVCRCNGGSLSCRSHQSIECRLTSATANHTAEMICLSDQCSASSCSPCWSRRPSASGNDTGSAGRRGATRWDNSLSTPSCSQSQSHRIRLSNMASRSPGQSCRCWNTKSYFVWYLTEE